MKKINSNLICILIGTCICVFSTSLFAQSKPGKNFSPGGYDSLLFDGAESISDEAGKMCKVKVMWASGIAIGTRCVTKTTSTCGDIDTVEVCEEGRIFPDYLLKAGEKISTGFNGHLDIMLSDGKTIRFAENTSIVINSNYCDNNFNTQVQLEEGVLFINARPNNKVKGITVSTEYGSAITEGTQFSYEKSKEGGINTDILKVYEGSVKFQRLIHDDDKQQIEDKSSKMKILTDEFQAGKISIEEFTKKMEELQKDLTVAIPKNAITVSEGFQSKIVGTENPSESESIDINEKHWWEDKNFK